MCCHPEALQKTDAFKKATAQGGAQPIELGQLVDASLDETVAKMRRANKFALVEVAKKWGEHLKIQWVDETVPNLAWANPSEYPDQVEPIDPGVPGDLNGDGRVNGADLGLLLAAWNSSDIAADLDGSGVVDGADLGLLLVEWTG